MPGKRNKAKWRSPQITIREVLLLTVIVALVVGWWVDHQQRIPQEVKRMRDRLKAEEDLLLYHVRLWQKKNTENEP